MATFIIRDESGRLREFEVSNERVVIGRSKRCAVRIKDESISSTHAAIEKVGDGYYILDLDSTNGIRLNSQKVKRELISAESVFYIGKLMLQMKPAPGAQSAAAPDTTPESGTGVPPVRKHGQDAHATTPLKPAGEAPPAQAACAQGAGAPPQRGSEAQPPCQEILRPDKDSPARPAPAVGTGSGSRPAPPQLASQPAVPRASAAADEQLRKLSTRQVTLYRWVAVVFFLLTLCGVAAVLYYFLYLRYELMARRPTPGRPTAKPAQEQAAVESPSAIVTPADTAAGPADTEEVAAGPDGAEEQPIATADANTEQPETRAAPLELESRLGGTASVESAAPVVPPQAWLAIPLNSPQLVRTKKGQTLQGTLVAATPFSIDIRIGDGSVSVTRTFPIEQVESIGSLPINPDFESLFAHKSASIERTDSAALFKLAMWCKQYGLQEKKDETLNAVVALNPANKAARKELRHAFHDGKWQPVAELEKLGLHQYKEEWFTEEQLRAKGLFLHEGEWLTETEMMKRKGLVRFGDKWVTEDEKKLLQKGQVNYLGVWVPASAVLELMKDSWYEALLRKLRSLSEEEAKKQAARLLAYHFRAVSDKIGSRLNEAQRSSETERILVIVRQAKSLNDPDFEVSARVLAQQLQFTNPAESYGYRRFADFATTFVCVELEKETASHNLAAALGLDSHQVLHMWLLTQDAQELCKQYKYRVEKANKTAEDAFQKLRDALINGVNVGFDTPKEIEGQAGGAEHKLKVLRDELWQALRIIEDKAFQVLTPDQAAMASAYEPSLLPQSPKDLKVALEARRQKEKEEAAGRKEPPPKCPERPGELGNVGNYLLNSAAASYFEARLKAERVDTDALLSSRSCGREKCPLNALHSPVTSGK